MDHNRINYEFINTQLENMSIDKRLQWIWLNFRRPIMASSFGLSTVALMDIYYRRLGFRIPVIFLDTLYHFPETIRLVQEMRQKYDLNLRIYRPTGAETRETFEAQYGPNLWEQDIERFHELTKLQQMRRALQSHDVWITGVRRDQSLIRRHTKLIHWDEKHGLVKMNPCADWSLQQVFSYVREHEVPYNRLHDRGYLSIGDEPLTEPVADRTNQRAGRWPGFRKTECGLHV